MSVGTLTGYHYNPGSSVLMFSDKDYISTLKTKTDADKLDYEILTEQNDVYSNYMKAHSNSDTNIYQFLSTSSVEIKSMLDTPNLTTDGYAVYLQNDFSLIEDWINTSALTPGNSGSIKFTSQGLYSVDLEISSEVLDEVENVKLLELDKIIESFKSQLPEKYLPEKFNNAEKITIGGTYLKYMPLAGDTNDGYKYSNIPVWVIDLWEGDQPQGSIGEAYVNAMDIPKLRENTICPKAASQMPKSNNDSHSGWKSSFNPIPAPGSRSEHATTMIMIINNNGTKTLETRPNPSSRSRCEMDQIITHPISMAMATIGTKVSRPEGDVVV